MNARDQADDSAGSPRTALIVLAAGAGTRMKSSLAKPLHRLAGLTMVEHVLEAGAAIEPDLTILVASEQTAGIPEAIGRTDISIVIQNPPRGTGHALRLALEAHPGIERCVMLYADHPLLTGEVVARLFEAQGAPGVKLAALTMPAAPGTGYGRIERTNDHATRIIEKADDIERYAEYEANSGMMALDAVWALPELRAIKESPKGEFYVTDLVEAATRAGGDPWPVTTVQESPEFLWGINDRVELANAETLLLNRIQTDLMRSGVTIRRPETVTIEAGVTIGPDTVIEPGCVIRRGTIIGSGCAIGPNAIIEASSIGNNVRVVASMVERSRIGDGSDVGPFSHLRAGSDIAAGVHIGNYVEVKQSRLESGVRVGHVSYLGDAHIGPKSNIGAGTITANYDGTSKHPTTVGANVLIGSDTMLVAPVNIGDGAKTGAGSVVTRDVAPGETVIGVPAKPRNPAEPKTQGKGEHQG
ncbi:MAG: bifunctional UDP-N-acetylglucosamine diphosphorylase/glucosamine-1-phosphate N-acetyltransferase GlmU [Thermomicrobiales bacterium]|nr:bifunctional UDP-N-acetylglucosamine diphosphorylase/glucosamine-1-phosphate N-acetyltransferase GlmU [Thermomicrobiales bacterium]